MRPFEAIEDAAERAANQGDEALAKNLRIAGNAASELEEDLDIAQMASASLYKDLLDVLDALSDGRWHVVEKIAAEHGRDLPMRVPV